MSFPLTHIYGVTRKEYYKITGITPDEMVRFLEAEVGVLSLQKEKLRRIYHRKPYTSSEGRYIAKLLTEIDKKIRAKQAKIRDIQTNDSCHSNV